MFIHSTMATPKQMTAINQQQDDTMSESQAARGKTSNHLVISKQ